MDFEARKQKAQAIMASLDILPALKDGDSCSVQTEA